MLETSARLLRLLSVLQTPRDWTGPQLAERLGVTVRTVRNDVERLRALGYPVLATRGAVGGYRLGAGSALPPLLLDDEEAVAIAVGLRTAASGSVTGVEESSLRALAKLEQVLPSRLRRRVNALQSFVVPVEPERRGPTVHAQVLADLTAACRDHEVLRFDYQNRDGSAPVRRSAEPYRLVNWGRRWYLLAWDLGRKDWRTFRVDRLVPHLPAGPRFAPRPLPDEDVARYVSNNIAAAPWRVRATVTVNLGAEDLAARVPVFVGAITAIDEHTCELATGGDSPETIAAYLGLIGADFTVTDPPELAAAVRKLSERYARAAGASG
ncbi:MAG TPA: YafY family protein [Actinocrinis sp.]|jgi:predicted DNA-binding transcriptional regulator YafY